METGMASCISVMVLQVFFVLLLKVKFQKPFISVMLDA